MLLEGKNGQWTISKYSLELGLPRWLSSKKSACAAGDVWDRCPGRGHDNPLQYSCLENPTDRGVWRAMVHWAAKSRTQL